MLATTQWPLERAANLTSFVWVCVLWLPESLMGLSALWHKPHTNTPTIQLPHINNESINPTLCIHNSFLWKIAWCKLSNLEWDKMNFISIICEEIFQGNWCLAFSNLLLWPLWRKQQILFLYDISIINYILPLKSSYIDYFSRNALGLIWWKSRRAGWHYFFKFSMRHISLSVHVGLRWY